MNRYFRLLAIVLITFASAGMAFGIITTSSSYNYYVTIPSQDGNSPGAYFDLLWIGAPLNPNGIGYGNLVTFPTGSPLSGYSPYSISWTTTIGSPLDSEIMVQFVDANDNYVAFTFIEPDSFWATTGTNMPFPAGAAVTGLVKFPDIGTGGIPVWGPTQEGAFYADPLPCSGCTITATAVPEPMTLLLLGSGLVGVKVIRRKLSAR